MEHLASNLPTNKGVVIVGGPGTGKTALLLKLVEMSCFGRGEPIYQGMFLPVVSTLTYFGEYRTLYVQLRAKNPPP